MLYGVLGRRVGTGACKTMHHDDCFGTFSCLSLTVGHLRKVGRRLGWFLGIALLWSGDLFGFLSPAEASPAFTYQGVIAAARELAKHPYQDGTGQVPQFLLNLDYDSWRDIRFKPEYALWSEEKRPFTVQFFHLGLFYDRPVTINVIDSRGVNEVRFSPEMFTYGKNTFQDQVPPDLGFAGFRLHAPINTKDYYDEVVVFLGATYLRAVAQGQQYGIAASGLALDITRSEGEEHPYFREFWIARPLPTATEVTVYALLDSRSVTGAYRYVITAGKETLVKVTSTLFMRRDVAKLCIAPLTSMFFYGEDTNQRPVDDFRPEVHDSDGLLMAFASGEWLWRPLRNPHMLQIHSFDAPDPRGFGLLQRDRDFSSYQDLEARYDLRPGVWIAPAKRWGPGHVELIQIPTDSEANNNIIAFWVPDRVPGAGDSVSFSYTMSWNSSDGARPPSGRVVASRTAQGRGKQWTKKFIIDFAGGQLEAFPADKGLTAVITVDERTRLIEQQLYKNRATKGWRLVFQILIEEEGTIDKVLTPKPAPLEFRAFLKDGENAVTETWSYAFQPLSDSAGR